MTDTTDTVLHQLDTRLVVVEGEIKTLLGQKQAQNRWLMALVVLSIGYVVSAIYGFAKLENTVGSMNLASLEQNVSTALGVLKDHGTEIAAVEAEQARIRGAHDLFHIQIENLRNQLTARTADRWYREDGMENRRRIERLEDTLFDGVQQ